MHAWERCIAQKCESISSNPPRAPVIIYTKNPQPVPLPSLSRTSKNPRTGEQDLSLDVCKSSNSLSPQPKLISVSCAAALPSNETTDFLTLELPISNYSNTSIPLTLPYTYITSKSRHRYVDRQSEIPSKFIIPIRSRIIVLFLVRLVQSTLS